MPNFSFYKENFVKKGLYTSGKLLDRLLTETGVALLPLSDFGMPAHFFGARLSYVDFDGAKALTKIKENPDSTAKNLAPKVVEGVQLLCDWIKN